MRLLYITTYARSKFGSFAKSSIAAAVKAGIEYHIAANETGIDQETKDHECSQLGIYHHHIDIHRNPMAIRQNRKAYLQVLELMKAYHFDVIHCNTPVGGIIGRLCAEKTKGTYVIYMAHGFHFYKGAPFRNWLLYYPVEKYLAKLTDVLITINRDDYKLATQCLNAKRTEYVHGVGIDLSQFDAPPDEKAIGRFRAAMGCEEAQILLLSVGELNDNKNHAVMIRALAECADPRIHYAIAGAGDKKEYLLRLAESLGVAQQVHLLGFVTNMPDLYHAADVFVFPSKREGLPSAVMEAMACGLPCVVSRIRGSGDLIDEGKGGFFFDPADAKDLAAQISRTISLREQWLLMGKHNQTKVRDFRFDVAVDELTRIYESIKSDE